MTPSRGRSAAPHTSLCTPWTLAALAVVLGFSLAGCVKKTLRKSELRAVTAEVVTAAQAATGHKSEITIRPEIQSSATGAGHLAADDIYISL